MADGSESLAFEVLDKDNLPSIDDLAAVGALLGEAFPPDELGSMDRPRPKDLAGTDAAPEGDGENSTLVLRDGTGRIAALMMFSRFPRFTYISYFAVGSSLRNGGIGGRMLDHFVSSIERSSGRDVPIVLEVELPNTEIATRRIGFYERHGFVCNDGRYIVPALDGSGGTVEMRIMSYCAPLDGGMFDHVSSTLRAAEYPPMPGC